MEKFGFKKLVAVVLAVIFPLAAISVRVMRLVEDDYWSDLVLGATIGFGLRVSLACLAPLFNAMG